MNAHRQAQSTAKHDEVKHLSLDQVVSLLCGWHETLVGTDVSLARRLWCVSFGVHSTSYVQR